MNTSEERAKEIILALDFNWETFDGISTLPEAEWEPPMNDLRDAIAAALSAARREERAKSERCHAPDEAGPLVTISRADYLRLIEGAYADGMIAQCDRCGAWIDRDDEAFAHVEDYSGCWKAATDRRQDDKLCRSYRVSEIALPDGGGKP